MRFVTWNMGHWHYAKSSLAAWAYLRSLQSDAALLQEAAPAADAQTDDQFVFPALPWAIDKNRPWGSGITSRWPISQIHDVRTIYGRETFTLIQES